MNKRKVGGLPTGGEGLRPADAELRPEKTGNRAIGATALPLPCSYCNRCKVRRDIDCVVAIYEN
ncbi:hypothetical protein [Paraburkholderia sp.]|uniref:hypothetical protein n=1 Tax=Paraburkholderia sp. TaxID=1926495 RepID=UPI003D6FF008